MGLRMVNGYWVREVDNFEGKSCLFIQNKAIHGSEINYESELQIIIRARKSIEKQMTKFPSLRERLYYLHSQ